MMDHPDESRLLAFLEGEVDETDAVALALHLDACPRCASRLTRLDPLSEAFAAIPEPPIPHDLPRAILTASMRPVGLSTTDLGLVAGLFASASLLALAADPVDALLRVLVLASTSADMADLLWSQVGTSLLPLTFLAGVACCVVAALPALATSRRLS